MAGFFDNLLHAGENAASDVGGFFGRLATGNQQLPGLGVSQNQIAEQIPSAIGQAAHDINQVTADTPVGRTLFGSPQEQQQVYGGPTTLTNLMGDMGGPGTGRATEIGDIKPAAQAASQGVGFFKNLAESGVQALKGTAEEVSAHFDGQQVQGDEQAISNFAKQVANQSNSPATATFTQNPQGNDTQHIFSDLKNPWGLLNELSKNGVAASFDKSGNVVAHDTDGAATGVINQIVKDSRIQPPTTVKGDYNIQEGDQYAASQRSAVQPTTQGATGTVPNQAAKDSGGVQNPNVSTQPGNTLGQSENQVLADRNKVQNKQNASAYRDSVLSGAKEDQRLTNPDALRQAMEYNKLPASASPEDTIPVYRAGKGGDLQPGDYVSVSKKMDESYAERTPGLEISKESVPLHSLVKSDGLGSEFVYSPVSKEALATGVRGTAETKAAAGLPVPKGEVAGGIPENVDPLEFQVSGRRAVLENIGKGETDILKAGDRSAESKTFGARAESAFSNASGLKSEALTRLEEARKSIPKGEQEAVIDALEGKDVQLSAKGQAWVDQAKSVLGDFANKAKATGLRVYDPASNSFHDFQDIENFYPHYATKEVQEALQGKSNAVTRDLIAKGLAEDPSGARAYLNKTLNNAEARRYGHLEVGRTDSNLPYIKDPKMVEQYVKDASDRIAWANQFGRDNEDAQKLIAGMTARGDTYGAQQATKFLQKYGNLREADMVREGTNKLVSGVRTAETTSKLEFVALKHLSQIPRAMAQNGVFRSLAQVPDAIGAFVRGENSPEVRQLSEVFHDDLVSEDFMKTDSNKIGNAFMKAVGFKNTIGAVRELAARGASAQLDSFISRGGATADRFLAKAGLDAEKIRAAGGPTLQERQQYVEKALQNTSLYFKKGSMPPGWDTGPGKLITMFKRFGYNDAVRGWANWVDEAKHGNVTPLIVATAGALAVGEGYVKTTQAIRGKHPKNQGFFGQLAGAAAAGGVGGLPGEQIAQAAQYPQYIGSQLTSLAGGPLASDVQQQVQNVGNLVKGTSSQQQSAVSSILGNVPIVGPAIQNRAAPAVTQALQAMGLTPQQTPMQKAITALTSGNSNPLGSSSSTSNPLSASSSSGPSAASRMASQRRASNALQARARRSASYQRSAGARRARAASAKAARSARVKVKTAKVRRVRHG